MIRDVWTAARACRAVPHDTFLLDRQDDVLLIVWPILPVTLTVGGAWSVNRWTVADLTEADRDLNMSRLGTLPHRRIGIVPPIALGRDVVDAVVVQDGELETVLPQRSPWSAVWTHLRLGTLRTSGGELRELAEQLKRAVPVSP